VVRTIVSGLSGSTVVILVTDGVPNCNPNAKCGPDECLYNIEEYSYEDVQCDDDFNCCDPANTTSEATLSCVDSDDTVLAVERLYEEGVSTFVIGMPGSELYADVLGRMATAGGTARAEDPLYYEVSDTSSLTEALIDIGASVAIPCEIELTSPPNDPNLINVYFDATLLEADEENGWAWDGSSNLSINGDACAELQSGNVLQVQVISGCSTIVK
jgi:hypothetical protein